MTDTPSKEYSFDEWKTSWNEDDIGFHESSILPDLVTHQSTFLTKKCRVFLPLCGKTLDLAYLADQGHDVFGCEFIQKAVEDFFNEQKLDFETSVLPSGISVFKAINKKITLYCGDFFALKSEEIGKFDAISDRGSLIVMNSVQRVKYAESMHDLMAPGCKYLLNTFVIDEENYQGPPRSVPLEEIERCFGLFCVIKELDCKPDNRMPSCKMLIVNTLLSLKNS